jgi:hypothetical protein
MSIISAICAEQAEKVRKEWVRRLKSVLDNKFVSDKNKLASISKITADINSYYFLE